LEARANATGEPEATFELHLPELAPLAALAGQTLHGSSAVRGTLRQQSDRLMFSVQADNAVSAGTGTAAGLIARPANVQLAGSRGARDLKLERLTFVGRTLKVSASGESEREGAAETATQKVQARYEVSVTDLRAVSTTLAGNARVTGRITGALPALA